MYPLIGKKVVIDYENAKFTLNFASSSVMMFEGNMGDVPAKDVVEYKSILVEKGVYMLYWFEPISKMLVTQVQNLNNFRVYTNIVSLVTTEFFSLKGKMTVKTTENTTNAQA